ncbi:MAG: methyltransferase domain-containing protein [Gammaproteobacteria bacterium]|nr:methyltransferase domain-containing protein [Gammaproteobacteria bacterium]MBV9727351.1 methyltransferase domain-containing protein [Gammaproteobacteria bacterium]
MAGKVDRPSEVGEYDPGMQTLLQLLWGEGFLSPGGAREVAQLLEGSSMAGCTVLDIGCGLGAVDELLIRQHGAQSVLGVDVDPALLGSMAQRIERAGLADRVSTLQVQPGPLPLPDDSFDVVFSKDAIVQIPDKAAVFADALRVLRPGGHLIVSDWLRGGSGAYSSEMLEFFRLEGIAYNMADVAETSAALTRAGFTEIQVRDRNAWYRDLARRELAALEGELRPLVTERIGTERTAHFIGNWRQMVLVLERGELRPAHLKARKPPHPA